MREEKKQKQREWWIHNRPTKKERDNCSRSPIESRINCIAKAGKWRPSPTKVSPTSPPSTVAPQMPNQLLPRNKKPAAVQNRPKQPRLQRNRSNRNPKPKSKQINHQTATKNFPATVRQNSSPCLVSARASSSSKKFVLTIAHQHSKKGLSSTALFPPKMSTNASTLRTDFEFSSTWEDTFPTQQKTTCSFPNCILTCRSKVGLKRTPQIISRD